METTVRHLEPRTPADNGAPVPYDAEAENMVCGVIMHYPQAYTECAGIITREDIYQHGHRLIWDVVGGMVAEGKPLHPVAVRNEIGRLKRLREVADGALVDRLGLDTIPPSMAASFALEIAEQARRRRYAEHAVRLQAAIIRGETAEELDALRDDFQRAEAMRGTGGAANPFANRLVPGGSFILDRPDTVPAIWGEGDQVLWAEGEALIIAGPPGVGKTTVAQQVILASIGLRPDALGMAVRPLKRVLYLASDRPQQAARSMARMVTAADRELLNERLPFWPGPPPSDFIKDPGILCRLAQAAGADAVVLDSLKDMAGELASEEGGQAINSAIQRTLVEGIEVIGLHHHRKQGTGKDSGKEPLVPDELYGSVWITAGAGSIVSLWGAPGDPVVQMRHLKQPAAEVGPWRLRHDHPRGYTEVWHQVDVLAMLRAAGSSGLTPAALAVSLYPNPNGKPTQSEVEKARRKLDQYVEKNLAIARKQGAGRTAPTAYFAAFDEQGVLPDED